MINPGAQACTRRMSEEEVKEEPIEIEKLEGTPETIQLPPKEEKPKRRSSKRKKEEEAEEAVQPPEKEEGLSERQLVYFYGREGLNAIKERRLREMLTRAPGIKNRNMVIDWVLYRFKNSEEVKNNPNALYQVLVNECGIPENVAYSIVSDLVALEREYAPVLMQRGEPVFYSPPPPAPQRQPLFPVDYARAPVQAPFPPQTFSAPTPQYTYQPPPYQPPTYQPPTYTPPPPPTTYSSPPPPPPPPPPSRPEVRMEDVRREVDSVRREIEERDRRLLERIDQLLEERLERRRQEDRIKELEGKLAELREGVLELRKELEVAASRPRGEEDEHVKALREQLGRYEEELRALHAKLEESERRRIEEQLSQARQEIAELKKELNEAREKYMEAKFRVVETYKSDAYKFIGQGMSELASVLKEKAPLQGALQTVQAIVAPETVAQPRAGEEARGGLASRLPKEWVE